VAASFVTLANILGNGHVGIRQRKNQYGLHVDIKVASRFGAAPKLDR
jgi:hypothetical protein